MGNEKDGGSLRGQIGSDFYPLSFCKLNSLVKALIIHGRWSLVLPF